MREVSAPVVSANPEPAQGLPQVQADKLVGYELALSSYGLPNVPCVYVLFGKTSDIAYVGQTKNLRLRLSGHRKTFGDMQVAYKVIEDPESRMRFESREMARLKPVHNRIHRVNLEEKQEYITTYPASKEVLAVGGSAISWNGFNLYGDKKSIDEVHRLMFMESLVAELRDRLDKCLRADRDGGK